MDRLRFLRPSSDDAISASYEHRPVETFSGWSIFLILSFGSTREGAVFYFLVVQELVKAWRESGFLSCTLACEVLCVSFSLSKKHSYSSAFSEAAGSGSVFLL